MVEVHTEGSNLSYIPAEIAGMQGFAEAARAFQGAMGAARPNLSLLAKPEKEAKITMKDVDSLIAAVKSRYPALGDAAFNEILAALKSNLGAPLAQLAVIQAEAFAIADKANVETNEKMEAGASASRETPAQREARDKENESCWGRIDKAQREAHNALTEGHKKGYGTDERYEELQDQKAETEALAKEIKQKKEAAKKLPKDQQAEAFAEIDALEVERKAKETEYTKQMLLELQVQKEDALRKGDYKFAAELDKKMRGLEGAEKDISKIKTNEAHEDLQKQESLVKEKPLVAKVSAADLDKMNDIDSLDTVDKKDAIAADVTAKAKMDSLLASLDAVPNLGQKVEDVKALDASLGELVPNAAANVSKQNQSSRSV